MPWTDFTCPDGFGIRIEDCLKKCRMDCGRCVSKPTLIAMAAGRRPWEGKISATQGINGTRLEYLKIRHDYAEAPVSRAFALLGTFHHAKHEKLEIPEALQEEFMEDDLGTGFFDYYDPEEKTLWDFKTAGAYKVVKALGFEKMEIPTEEIYKSGPKKGQHKTRPEWRRGTPDFWEWQMQLSRYAWMIQDAKFPVERCLVQATVRDYSAMTSKTYGLDRQIYVIEVPMLPREEVVSFYLQKQQALLDALFDGEMPPPCNDRETWDGRRCAGYCPVWRWCDVGVKAHEQAAAAEEVA